MRYAQINQGTVVNVIECNEEFALSIGAIPSETANVGDAYLNGTFERPEPVTAIVSPIILAERRLTALKTALQAHLSSKAKEYGYDSIHTAVSYADEPAVPRFQQEGRAFRAWRSLFWAQAYIIQAEVETGARSEPTLEQLIEELPKLGL